MQSLYLVPMLFVISTLSENVIQLYCPDNKYIKNIRVRQIPNVDGVVVGAECEHGSGGGKKRPTPIRYVVSGEIKLILLVIINNNRELDND